MFIKPFRIKSQTQLKGSERKKLRAELFQAYPSLTSNDLSKLMPNKEDVTLVRMYCYKGESVNVYQVQKDPLFFMVEKEKEIYPTVYLLWKCPDLMHTFTTHAHMNPHSYGKFEKGFPVAVNTTENKVPVAIGITAHSSMDMFMSGRHGKGVSILHVYGDQLWEMGTRSPPPKFGPPDIMLSGEDSLEKEDNIEEVVDFSETHEGEIIDEISRDQVTNALQELDLDDQTPDSLSSLSPEASPPQEETTQPTGPEVMDKLLLHCFLKAWKTSGKKVEVPILTSNFYRLHMIPACPDGASLDIKKSSYKKLSKFLNAMAKNELIQVKEFPKGIENITAVNWAHEDIKSFIVDKEETSIKPEVNKKDNSRTFIPPLIEEVNQVSGETVQFFKANGLRKEGYKETLRWDEIFSRVLGKMAPAVRITRHGSVPVIRKGKLEPIDLAVAKRSGNKKVTLVYNASIYGIDEAEFAHQIQVGVAASTSVGPAEHKPQGTTQVLIQGNQVAFVGKLLLETYHLPRKYIRGLELAGKSKK
ncbi:Eukaryotic translation initiation factor 2D-like [Homarus americanus]|uniref:Eukaryotic translation initiation factor 2D-like n=1 Tax=Homarus americanus TaxID=6706 RepID=A0A8J5JRV8_HOMAM|nr:Eukaryotic translation initiation factor 2D-like [Homarus americanus]